MARKNRLLRYLSVAWDRDAARRLEQEAEASLDKAGKESAEKLEQRLKEGGQKGARALTRALQTEYRQRMARARQQFAEDAIDEKQFRKEGEEAAREFNRGLTEGIRKLQTSTGGLTAAQAAGLQNRFKLPAQGRGGAASGMAAGALMGRFAGPLAGVFTAGAAIQEGARAIQVADEYEAALLRLEGTAALTGISMDVLKRESAAVREDMRLSIPIANDLTTEVARLGDRAGDVEQTGAAMRAFLDIGAARGLSATQTLQAVGQAVLGIDEGTDKLFGKNPSAIYKEYADSIGMSAGALSDQQKAQALLWATMEGGERTQGKYLEYLQSERGIHEQNNLALEERRAQLGEQLRESRALADQLKVELYPILADVLRVTGDLVSIAKEPIIFTVKLISSITGPLADFIRFSKEMDQKGERWWSERLGVNLPGAGIEEVEASSGRSVSARHTGLTGRARWNMEMSANRRRMAENNHPLRFDLLPPEPTDAEKRHAEQRIKAMHDHLDQWRRSQGHYDLLTGRAAGSPERGGIVTEALGVPDETEWDRHLELFQQIDVAATETAARMAEAFQDTFALMIEEGATVGNFFEGMARSAAGAVGQILAEFASGKAKENFAAAIEAAAYALGFTSHGNFPSASAAWGSAAEHTAAGLAWSALAGGAAAGGQAVRTRAPGSTYDAGFSTAHRAEREAGQVIVYVDPFNPGNPAHVRQVGRAMDLDVRLSGTPEWVRGR